jgi:protein-S-isoprenylcysteine O-methyltransferase Ste14
MRRVVRGICSLAAGAAFFTLWYLLLPRWLGFRAQMGSAPSRWAAGIASVLGFSVALQCVWDFAQTGRGSPAPFAPPRRLVIVGYYRHVRNPIYVGAAAGWIGLWIVFGHASLRSIVAAALAALGVHLFVVLYEEPTLLGKFGAQYEEYCRNVRRWWPRIRGWNQQP